MIQLYHNVVNEEALIERIHEKYRHVYSYICGNNNAGSKYG